MEAVYGFMAVLIAIIIARLYMRVEELSDRQKKMARIVEVLVYINCKLENDCDTCHRKDECKKEMKENIEYYERRDN